MFVGPTQLAFRDRIYMFYAEKSNMSRLLSKHMFIW